ncbi:hypothetical protein HQ584_02645 [Patescibacteria group bacterium]|nr:hypothetical protein [Patescibacteria group bacterium]
MSKIKLCNGVVINDPEDRIREYCRVEIYYGYDDCHEVNNAITQCNIDAANKLFARISKMVAERIIQSENIRNTLTVIDDKELGEINKEEWRNCKEKLYNLLISFCSIKGVGIAVATKILHLKRPKLIPILDSFVVKFLLGIDTQNVWDKQHLIETGIKATEIIREDIRENWEDFITLQEKLSDLPILLEKVRLYDILVWSTEKWDIRGNLTAPYRKPKTPVIVEIKESIDENPERANWLHVHRRESTREK